MTDIEITRAEKIRGQYTDREVTKLDELRALDKRVKRPAKIFSYIFGILSALVLGLGMCLAMGIIGELMPLGIVIGILGIAGVSVNYFIYDKMITASRARNKDAILALTNEIIGNKK